MEEATPHTLHLSWMVTEGEFDSFEIQHTDREGQLQTVRTGGDRNDITLSGLESDHRYLVTLYGFRDGKHVGPVHVEALTGENSAHCASFQMVGESRGEQSPADTLPTSVLSFHVSVQSRRRRSLRNLPPQPPSPPSRLTWGS